MPDKLQNEKLGWQKPKSFNINRKRTGNPRPPQVNRKSTPFLIVAATTLIAILLAGWMAFIAVHQPWLGLELDGEDLENGLRIVAVSPDGPSSQFMPGDVLVRLDNGNDRTIDLEPFDIVEEADGVATYTALARFFGRQDILYRILSGNHIFFTKEDGTRMAVDVASTRPVSDLPLGFWVQISVGLVGSIIGACVWALRPQMPGARTLGVSGVALLASTYPSAIYLNRELALGDPFFYILNTINPLGSLAFAVSLLVMFLVYPRRLLPPTILALIIAGFGIWWLLDALRIGFTGPGLGRYLPLGVAALSAPVMAGIQYRAARNEPHLQAALVWFGLSLILSTVIFILLYVTPSLIGEPSFAPQGVSYALAILVYAGIALGIVRYRLFDLDRWAFRILFYLGGAVAFAAIDVFLVSVIALDTLPAFSVALLIVALIYLPLRDFLMRRLMPTPGGREAIFQKVVGIALTSDGTQRNSDWIELLRTIYDPLSIDRTSECSAPKICDDGLILLMPGHGYVAPLKLSLAQGGRKLFSSVDLSLADELCAMLVYTSQSRDAFEQGTAQERDRISRDTHDNIGAKLLSALHGKEPERKNAMIREALSELRDIINNPSGANQSLEESLAELRLETVERLSAYGLSLNWKVTGDPLSGISQDIIHALRSIIRECISNTLRHAEALAVSISIVLRDRHLHLIIADDGRGIPENPTPHEGLGLDSIRARVDTLGGSLETINVNPGFRLTAAIPVTRRSTP